MYPVISKTQIISALDGGAYCLKVVVLIDLCDYPKHFPHLGADTKQTPQQEKVHLELCVHLGQLANLTQHLSNETICARKCGIHGCAHTCKRTPDAVLVS